MTDGRRGYLLARARTTRVALPLQGVEEIAPPLPLESVAGLPPYLLGLSVLRGTPVPVVDLGALLGSSEQRDPRRLVALKVGPRRVALAVEEVIGVRSLASGEVHELAPLIGNLSAAPLTAALAADPGLGTVLDAARLIPDEVWSALSARAERS